MSIIAIFKNCNLYWTNYISSYFRIFNTEQFILA